MTVATLGMMLLYSPPLAAIAIAAMSLYALGRWIWYRPLRNATEEQIVPPRASRAISSRRCAASAR